MLRPLFFLTLYSVLLGISPATVATSSTEQVKGALCIVRADDKLVLVHEILTNRISLPGGTIVPGESPKAAAQRETWEETGLVVTVGKELGRTETAVFFNCVSDSEIISYSMNNSMGGDELPIWFAPHYGVEIASAMLLAPEQLSASAYRYPAQWQTVVGYFSDATHQPVHYIRHLIKSAPSFRQIELDWMMGLQNWVGSLSATSFQTAYQVADLVLELTKPTILLFLIPFVMMRFGSRFVFRLFFAISVTSVMSLVAQQGFSLPRPHVYMPMVELSHSFGFSFPSLPIAVWCCVLTFLFHKTGNFGVNGSTGLIIGMTLLVVLAKFFLGTAFILDMLLGALLGILVAWHILRLEVNPEIHVDKFLTSKGVWLVMTAFTAVICVIWPLPVFGNWLAILMAASVIVLTFDKSQVQLSGTQTVFVILALILAQQLYLYSATSVSYSGFWSLVFITLQYPMLMLLFTLLVRKLTQGKRLKSRVLDAE
ncbi:bifunctional NUDIX hydrolase/phosphatase PAP2 family protein [uncultured Vibrio sp.]|uniref:bifunctional NUDIX hydrolase/phosphatase PAP2 family protein n=1 Tax=uncultured Vibrio sp. TaxID=114054 RepID=UPI002AA870E4|nr:bifunctional NUDIX hydrolase/phosphatase PAP2 family protein [uncultured Vibrio sp.]